MAFNVFPDVKHMICVFQSSSHGLTTVIKYIVPKLPVFFNYPKGQCEITPATWCPILNEMVHWLHQSLPASLPTPTS